MKRSGKLRILVALLVLLIPACICANRGGAMAQNGVEACSSNIALVRELIGAGPSCGTITAEEYPPIYLRGQIEPTANVIMLIPDGAGLTHRTLARIVYGGANSRLPSEKMWEVGIADTHSADALVTDSAAAATQLATGYWTNNGMISVTPEGALAKTILELAKEQGKSTGLVATSRITHATPAAFGGHCAAREDEDEIALWMLANEVDVLIGGGRRHFLPDSGTGKRMDNLNLLSEFRKSGWEIADSFDSLRDNGSARICALLANSHLPPAPNREYTLQDLTHEAIRRLSTNPRGFFLMVEGSQIDFAAHMNDEAGVVEELLDFEGAVAEAFQFAKVDGNTLVVVVADHETGGLAIVGGSTDSNEAEIEWACNEHTGSPVVVYSYGPNSYLLGAHIYLADIPFIIARSWGATQFGPERKCLFLSSE
ncbi:MAG: alkaline phosphatase [Firmicutes bacterium]|nr:alkaline phosphatase [Bacillota bacterium]